MHPSLTGKTNPSCLQVTVTELSSTYIRPAAATHSPAAGLKATTAPYWVRLFHPQGCAHTRLAAAWPHSSSHKLRQTGTVPSRNTHVGTVSSGKLQQRADVQPADIPAATYTLNQQHGPRQQQPNHPVIQPSRVSCECWRAGAALQVQLLAPVPVKYSTEHWSALVLSCPWPLQF